MSEIVLTTLNARYWHSSFGLRYLMANMGELTDQTVMLEFGINQNTVEILETIILHEPKIVGIGVYIWNIEEATKLVADLKNLRPEIIIVIGGPEVSYESETQEIVQLADYLVTGEADLALPELCKDLLSGFQPLETTISGGVPALDQVQMPYHLYTEEDIRNRVIYVEASRGCPFTCEFCLSALEIPVRQFEVEDFLNQMQSLLDQGARQFKFVDRTFNLNMRISQAILKFFLDRYQPGLFLHFEMIPDRLPDSLRTMIQKFPAGALQFEIGVQTFNDTVGEFISRRQDNEKLADNFRFLREETGVHIHADLIVGLPGETIESFGAGFDKLLSLDPQEIQVGVLKRLRGTPIIRHDDEWEMLYSSYAPYEILSNRLVSFEQMQRLRRFAKYWDLIGNSGNFLESREKIWAEGQSPFVEFFRLTDWLYGLEGQTHGIPLTRLVERMFNFLTQVQQLPEEEIAFSIWNDYTRNGREDRPHFLRKFDLPHPKKRERSEEKLPQRQARHTEKMT
ncbi:B12-binding domain-containing radical SAM protein [Planctomicrobium sp.]|jgi:radical SAM superfamily enzyme YgiQ (UPF0313 family)|nr:B12-binding domain-containing radical SAM protein [Planctomicrobium sp.]MDB4732806.1 B12-binding domain-containing radical SAM protein [Planctomicrobium sp.]